MILEQSGRCRTGIARTLRRGAALPRGGGDMSENPGEAGGVRLNKALADAGLCSRRKADELILPYAAPALRLIPEEPTALVRCNPAGVL